MSNPGNTSLAKAASFVANSATAAFTDLLSITYSEGGSAVELTTDNAATVNAMFQDSIKGAITVTCSDPELIAASFSAALSGGATGPLTISFGRRAAGKGQVSGHTLAIVFANAQFQGHTTESAVVGSGHIAFTFGAYDPAGVAVSTKTIS